VLEEHGIPPRGACGLDAAVGGVLGEVQHLSAVSEERRTAR
jgi:hypothetical protein